MGKTLGKDADSGKLTCVCVYGMSGTVKRVQQLRAEALKALEIFDARADFFRDLVNAMVDRTV